MSEQPNIILINCDDLGYGDLGCYGSEVNKTPNLDRLAAEGRRFTDFYMASSVCSPSRGAMMTGCYPPRISFGNFENRGVLFPGMGIGLNPDEITVAKQLKQAGYATKIVGKWHCGDQPEFLPTRHGFDDYFGIPYSNDMGRQGREVKHPPLPLMRGERVAQEQPDQRTITERYTMESTDFIFENKDKPFFLYLAHMYVHVPLFVPRKFLEKSANGAYGGAVECIDWSTGVLMDFLKQHGLDENTLIVFTSDNGSRARGEGGSNLPCQGHKGQNWEGGIRVPMIMRWPKQIKPGKTCEHITRSIDFMPTFSKLAGVDLPQDRKIDGVDISSYLTEENAKPVNDVFFYYRMNQLIACRMGDWKLFLHSQVGYWHIVGEGDNVKSLYNLRDDVGETNNVIEDHPDIVEKIMEKVDAIRKDIGDDFTGTKGENVRPIGKVDDPKPLTEYREDHPYMVALYDLPDMPTMAG